ncbi:MAG: glutamine--fructose-6-phosphate transaminase (isomerizing), partial [Planctomycetota bacterium]
MLRVGRRKREKKLWRRINNMCGIIGYSGSSDVQPILLEGLKRLEYRGYDSAGIAVSCDGEIEIRRKEGKVSALEDELKNDPTKGTAGIAHTRWATHGRPSEINAHPHRAGEITLVHNGIIENYLELKRELEASGHSLSSETDTEVIAHLISEIHRSEPNIILAVRKALHKVKGSYGIALMKKSEPGRVIAARKGSPLILGIGDGESYIASDIPAILWRTREVKYMEDGDIASLESGDITIFDESGKVATRDTSRITWDPVMAEKAGYRHFMLKEIYEQPRALADTISPRINEESGKIYLEDLKIEEGRLKKIKKITIVACGTSWHAALVGKFLIESISRIPVEVDIASEFRYRDPVIAKDDLVIAVTQSGETADTMAAIKEAKLKGALTVSICNVVGSSISRETDGVIYTHAGPEIGVASTKAFTTQIAALYLFELFIAQIKETIEENEFK